MESLRARLLGAAPAAQARSHRIAWIGIAVATLIGGALRLWRLGHPSRLVFDETYYVKQAWSLVLFGHEMDIKEGLEEPNPLFESGNFDIWGTKADLVVHPPIGKWMIALGQMALGPEHSESWRISSAVVGTLSILIIGHVAWLIWKNALLAISASTLLAVDGHHFVQSRIGLLDIFVMFWALLAFWFLLLDREQGRSRLARKVSTQRSGTGPPARTRAASAQRRRALSDRWGPWLGVRWWRVAAGVALGLCIGTKWSGLYFLAVFGLLTVWWDMGARRAAGVPRWFIGTVVRDGIPAFVKMVPVALVTYVASWAGWFATDDGWKRQWAVSNPAEPGSLAALVPDPLRSLWAYHVEQMTFHVGLQNEHAWSSHPWSWTVQWRPTLFFAEWPTQGEQGCEVDSCVAYIASLGNLFVWWGGTIGLVVVAFCWLLGRDWRAAAVASGLIAGWLPWFLYQTRTIYSFYAVAFVPWLVLVVVYCLGLVLGSEGTSLRRRQIGASIVVLYVVLAVAMFIWYFPVHTAQVIPRSQWNLRLWFDFWT